ncbi:MAG TPA: bifunctional phosphoribosyl-AMP cyclohydrolase/phosphoribosyl-ATP diphosphatase HisIE [Enhygromyxa sp.]|nr:bifunctional phosphoribosyl-AMP cyclohydrolase/phosphoribosyl-ATP diphosphatase HisIE [Enhygromyxa sp.]
MTVDELWSSLAPNADGLVAAIVVHADDGRVLMLGYQDRDALAATLATRKVTFFSRSKQRLWQKGESSGHTLELRSLRVDCDGDALLIAASPNGPTCHTGTSSCFFKPIELSEPLVRADEDDGPTPTRALDLLWQTILDRKAGRGMTNAAGKSYVRSLLDAGPAKLDSKLREEAAELGAALREESDERVASEAADLLFHALVGLAARDLSPADVAELLRRRHGLSGIDEKAGRG